MYDNFIDFKSKNDGTSKKQNKEQQQQKYCE